MFYLIDKPENISSFDVIRKLRKILNTRKMGHVGTLDPFATGCLLIATGNSTKLIPLLENAQKEYITTIRFDGTTASFDTETEVIKTDTSGLKERTNDEIVNFLLSQKFQIPPIYSAIHVDGKRAYDKARKGENFELKERPIDVFEVEVLKKEPFSITIRLIVSSGCYIRSFAPLVTHFFGGKGGYLSYLRRTKIITKYGTIGIENSSNIDNINEISYSTLFHTIHTYELSSGEMHKLLDGVHIPYNYTFNGDQNEYIFSRNQELGITSLCRIENSMIIPLKNKIT